VFLGKKKHHSRGENKGTRGKGADFFSRGGGGEKKERGEDSLYSGTRAVEIRCASRKKRGRDSLILSWEKKENGGVGGGN